MKRSGHRKIIVLLAVLVVATMLIGQASTPGAQTKSTGASRSVTVLVGAGKDTSDINAFFPFKIRIRAGDTVTWKQNGDEIHTVTFWDGKMPRGARPEEFIPDPRLGAGGADVSVPFDIPMPGGGRMIHPMLAFATRQSGAPVERWTGTGFINSGIMTTLPPPPGQKPNVTFSATFPKPGVYTYLCLVHLSPMLGTVDVVPANALGVLSQADIDRQAQREMEPMLPLLDKARVQMQVARKEPGPNDTTIWFVKVGSNEWYSGDLRVQVLEFGPKTLTIKAGDTVVWGGGYFHAVTFHPTPPPPTFVVPKPQPQGPPFLSLNPDVIVPAKPTATYDPTKHYTSGILGPFSPDGWAWALTFDQPGTYEYDCPVHREQGMKGTIVVQAR